MWLPGILEIYGILLAFYMLSPYLPISTCLLDFESFFQFVYVDPTPFKNEETKLERWKKVGERN
jgi:hypothetical protein